MDAAISSCVNRDLRGSLPDAKTRTPNALADCARNRWSLQSGPRALKR